MRNVDGFYCISLRLWNDWAIQTNLVMHFLVENGLRNFHYTMEETNSQEYDFYVDVMTSIDIYFRDRLEAMRFVLSWDNDEDTSPQKFPYVQA